METGSERVRLRSDLDWTLHQFADGRSYTVTDPKSGSNFQVGLAEYGFASMLDGKTTIEQAAAATRSLADRTNQAELAIQDEEGMLIAAWLVKMKLATDGDCRASWSNPQLTEGQQPRRWTAITVRMPLGDPSAAIDRLFRWLGPLTSRFAVVSYLVLIAVALVQVLCDLPAWTTALRPLANPNVWWIIGVIALALRLVHEAAHALAAKRLNIRVDQMGILWILLMPLPYLDVSRSWQCNRRRERIAIVAAGMLSELVVAAIAVIAFTWSTSDFFQHLAATIAVTASAMTLLFNANVLMRFDGYHILVDLLGLPNLYSDAACYWCDLSARVVLGKRRHRAALPGGWLGVFIRGYGLAAAAWRVIVVCSLILAAEHLLGGLGALLSFAAIVGILITQLKRLPLLVEGTRPLRVALGVAAVIAVLVACWRIPLPGLGAETGVVQYFEPSFVRAGSDGFVTKVYVQRGDAVRPGQLLASIENVALASQTALLELEVAEAELKHRRFLADGELAAADAQWSSIQQLRRQLARRRDQLDALTMRAKAGGVVRALEDLSLWLGRYVPEGTPLMSIVREDQKEIVMLVRPDQREAWADRIGRLVPVRSLSGFDTTLAKLSFVAPQATDQLAGQPLGGHLQSLGAHQGGPLSVRPTARGDESYRLLRPRFEVRLRPADPAMLRDGERLSVAESETRTIGNAVGETLYPWLDSRIARHSLLRQWSSF